MHAPFFFFSMRKGRGKKMERTMYFLLFFCHFFLALSGRKDANVVEGKALQSFEGNSFVHFIFKCIFFLFSENKTFLPLALFPNVFFNLFMHFY